MYVLRDIFSVINARCGLEGWQIEIRLKEQRSNPKINNSML